MNSTDFDYTVNKYFTEGFINTVKFCSSFGMITYFYMILDRIISKRFKNPYYLIHSINNAIVVYYSYPAVEYSIKNINTLLEYNTTPVSTILTGALHAYHIIEYKDRLIYYDYLHHGTMCFIALPLGIYVNFGPMLDFALFFLSGLPGAIDYMLLFLARNNFIKKITEKKINNSINLWIRCPGCISQATLSLVICLGHQYNVSYFDKSLIFITMLLVFWNGIYFMKLVVADYAIQEHLLKQEKNQSNNSVININILLILITIWLILTNIWNNTKTLNGGKTMLTIII